MIEHKPFTATNEERARICGEWFALPEEQTPAGILAAMEAAPGTPEEWQSIADMLEAGKPSDWLPCSTWDNAKFAYKRHIGR